MYVVYFGCLFVWLGLDFFRGLPFFEIFYFFKHISIFQSELRIQKTERGRREDILSFYYIFLSFTPKKKSCWQVASSTEVWLSHTQCFYQSITSSIIFVHACAWGLSPFYVIPNKTVHKFPKYTWKLTSPLHHWGSSILKNFLFPVLQSLCLHGNFWRSDLNSPNL